MREACVCHGVLVAIFCSFLRRCCCRFGTHLELHALQLDARAPARASLIIVETIVVRVEHKPKRSLLNTASTVRTGTQTHTHTRTWGGVTRSFFCVSSSCCCCFLCFLLLLLLGCFRCVFRGLKGLLLLLVIHRSVVAFVCIHKVVGGGIAEHMITPIVQCQTTNDETAT